MFAVVFIQMILRTLLLFNFPILQQFSISDACLQSQFLPAKNVIILLPTAGSQLPGCLYYRGLGGRPRGGPWGRHRQRDQRLGVKERRWTSSTPVGIDMTWAIAMLFFLFDVLVFLFCAFVFLFRRCCFFVNCFCCCLFLFPLISFCCLSFCFCVCLLALVAYAAFAVAVLCHQDHPYQHYPHHPHHNYHSPYPYP